LGQKSVIIIGSGLGGLQCGFILAERGYKVTVLEKHRQAGGCLQTFRRGTVEFDTGFHFVGGLEEGSDMREAFTRMGLMDLDWHKLDGEEVVIGKDSFFLPSGKEAFVDALCGYFPACKDGIVAYADALANVAKHPEYQEMNACQFVNDTLADPLLRKVVAGASLKMELDAERLPLSTYARINGSFMRSAWKVAGGGGAIVRSLSDSIVKMGGEILTGVEVVSLESYNGKVTIVACADGRRLSADYVISDIHPSVLVAMTTGLRRIYSNRVASLENTKGMFTANITLKKNAVPYENRTLFIHSASADLWHPSTDRLETVGVNFSYTGDGKQRSLDLMTRTMGKDRDALAHRCIDFVSRRIPSLADAVEHIYTSTPDTYSRFTGTPAGSAYGVVRDCNNTLTTVLSPRTPLSNLFLAGQNIGIHGVMGVTKSSMATCDEIIYNNI